VIIKAKNEELNHREKVPVGGSKKGEYINIEDITVGS
jgi:hypothetical protein